MEKRPDEVAHLNGAETASTVLEEKPRAYIQCNPHPFDKEDAEFKYVRGNVLPPETGGKNLIIPCHEFKSFQLAAKRDEFEQKIKFAKEVAKFAAACMNCRTNGTIHFGVEDGREYAHGEIVGVAVHKKELFVEARDKYVIKCFLEKYQADAERSIRPPRFVEVIGDDTGEQSFVIEVDIVPSLSVVKESFYVVRLPDLQMSKRRHAEYQHPSIYKREGASSIRVVKIEEMPEYVHDRDFEREKAERNDELSNDDVYRKLSELFISIKEHMNNEMKYILVTDSCKKEDLENLRFLLGMKFFCVLDFDPNSKVQGLCSLYPKASPYFLEDCITESNSLADYLMKGSFHQTSWIFCNGQNDSGGQKPYDSKTWMETRREHLVKMISQICNTILPLGTFEVFFLLLSPANQLLAQAFHEFYAGMNGRNNIKCIAENRENYNSWANLFQKTCNRETLNNLSIVGTKLSHLDSMIQTIQSSGLSVKQLLCDGTKYEDLLPCIEVLRSDECSCINVDASDEEWQTEIRDKEMHFYKGGKVSWMNFWLAENGHCGKIIKRDAYERVNNHLNQVLETADSKESVITLTISHQPGSGGSTVAHHILWDFRKRLTCATVNTSQPVKSVCDKAKKLQNNEESGKNLPVLLLVEDCDEEYTEELKIHLGRAVADCPSKPNFILLHCKRSTLANASDIAHVIYKLSGREKTLFNEKLNDLKKQSKYKENSILTFVLMTKEYDLNYLQKSVKELLESIDQESAILDLIGSIALLNHYVEDSYITGSQCEAFINQHIQSEDLQHLTFESILRQTSGCLLSHLYEPATELLHIRIIHRKVAEQILNQMKVPQSQTVTHLLERNVFFNYQPTTQMKFIRQLFLKRKDNADQVKLPFSSLIAHICEKETTSIAEDVLEKACAHFAKDAFVAQQFARFLCHKEKFEKAETWVKKAHILQPSNSYILHTEGQIYKNWLFSLEEQNKQQSSPQRIGKTIELALKAIDAFQSSQEASKSETDWNNAGYFGEVEVACYVVQCMPLLDIFKSKDGCHINLVKYLLTDWIPEQIDTAWAKFHGRLKGLHNNICKAMETIYEHMAYFQPDKRTEEKHFEKLSKCEKQFSYFFCFFNDSRDKIVKQEKMNHLMPILKCHKIYYLGGGRFTKMFSLACKDLIKIIQLCTDGQGFPDKNDLQNYILSQIALAVNTDGFSVAKMLKKEFCKLSHYLCNPGQSAIPYFIQVLLYWPEAEAEDDNDSAEENDRCLINALNTMNDLYKAKIKDVQAKKKPTYPHFFLGSGSGFQRFIHNTYIREDNEQEVNPNKPQRFEGWAEGNKLYVQGHCRESKVPIHRGPKCLIPPESRRVSFYLGFTLRGCVAYDIKNETEDGNL
ncbi:sterile alpha motif domain-containing protein 9-like isoform X2 [Carcharodon carcharias]|uniref:sterile alpha motif domain-containing protein 9-like isoform X2 n=1 Tax=Carcharodon carcharias TaxID=13397 RepID=UPI001B7DD1B5|nr:sterile alpha motif domain-containing protein 9-like isoform X2 [Carcharodon carcharias]XP_041073159.1 sterile alpha motif domain-containing protein 9-like isoform X2 [Carcharodon carcharias]XP_041073160.1 sterile alpha motif domain-containing protein 9-like isoform X2 [Carcharodon carcharias]XP_041073161.1 sterile alpha motif domain-containing protein 9-like isoform X2 [Carcharodon carcharias]